MKLRPRLPSPHITGLSSFKFFIRSLHAALYVLPLVLTFGVTLAANPRQGRITGWDALGSYSRLPFHPQVKGEFGYVRAKPLGDGFVVVPVKEFRGALLRPLFDNHMSIGVDFLIASGYTGQTLETIPSQPDPCPLECIVGVPLKSYLSASWTYYFKK